MMTLKNIKAALLVGIFTLGSAFADTKTILLIGQSGTGKTITLNALYNAAMYSQTPENSIETIEFLTALDRNESQSIPPEDNLYSAKNIDRIHYGRVTRGNSELTGPCSSDTDTFTGYRFTPQLKDWPQGDELEIIDTPGIDDTGRTLYDNHSTHLQVIHQIEQLLREKGDSIHAIVMVVNNNLTRTTDGLTMTLHAIREALPPAITERLFIIANHTEPKKRIQGKIQQLIQNHLSWQDGTISIPAQHYIPENPTYLARFNQYLNGSRHPKTGQQQREHTEHHLRELLQNVSKFNTPIPLHGYPQYLQYKHQVAQHIHDAVEVQLKIDTLMAKCETLQEKFQKEKKDYQQVFPKANVGDIASSMDHAVSHAIDEGVVTPYLAQAFATPFDWCMSTTTVFADLIKLYDHQPGADDPIWRERISTLCKEYQAYQRQIKDLQATQAMHTDKAQTAFGQMQTSEYGSSHPQSACTLAIGNRIQMHFPALYENHRQKETIDGYIDDFCQKLA